MRCTSSKGPSLSKPVYAYPFEDPSEFEKLNAGWLRRLVATYESWKVLRRRSRQPDAVAMTLAASRVFRPLLARDLPLVFLCRNNLNLLPAFLQHYRALGVTRFIVVDDQSHDGSKEWLESQIDVDVWISPVRYKEARRGRLWREALFRTYGGSRWYVNVDVDEFLVYDQCDVRSLHALIEVLTARRVSKIAAPMLDLYPKRPLECADYDSVLGEMPWTVADFFDSSGYELTFEKRYMSLRGGPRRRMFDAESELMKYPLLYWDARSSLGASIHQPLPYEGNFCAITGVLLHFKFFSDVGKRVAEAVADGQYFNGAAECRRILSELGSAGTLDFQSPVTTAYEGPEQLVRLGFMERLFGRD